VFLGYGRESHADTILAYGREHPDDWVYGQLRENPRYAEEVRKWMQAGVPESAQMRKEAEACGFGYFDLTDYQWFEEYAEAVTTYLLGAK